MKVNKTLHNISIGKIWDKLTKHENDLTNKLSLSGGKVTGDLFVGDNIRLYSNGEGGNIRITPPESKSDVIKNWEIDAYNGNLRIFAERQDGQHSFPITLHSEGEVSFANKEKTRKNLEVNNYNNNNLLINSNFANCVNQRGQTSYTNEGYHIDRWNGKWNGDGVITPENQGTPNGRLSIYRANYDGWIMQYLEHPNSYKGRTFTVSACVQNNCGLSARYFDSNGVSVSLGEFKNSSTSKNIISFTFTVPADADIAKFAIGFYGGKGTACYIYWVKLEEGNVATPFVPRPYAEELAICEKYYQIVSSATPIVYKYSDKEMNIKIGYNSMMLRVPTVKGFIAYTNDTSGGGLNTDNYILGDADKFYLTMRIYFDKDITDRNYGIQYSILLDAEIY